MRIRLGPNGKEKIGRNIHRMSSVSIIVREDILKRADEEFSEEKRKTINEFIHALTYDEKIFAFAGPNYSYGSLKEKVFRSAIVEYYQHHPELIIED